MLWFAMAVVAALAIVAFTALWQFVFRWRLRRVRKKGNDKELSSMHCLACGYYLFGLKTPRCPECGTLRGFKIPLDKLGLTEQDLHQAATRTRDPSRTKDIDS